MSFALFIIYLLVTLVRPGEQFPALREWPVTTVVSTVALAGAALAVLTGRGPSLRVPQVPIMLAFFLWTAVSVVASPLRSGSALDGVVGFAKSSGIAFLLVILNVTTARRLRIVAGILTACALFLAGQAIFEYRRLTTEELQALGGDSGSEWDGAEAPAPRGGVVSGEAGRVFIEGLFGDPNDLALSLVAILPFSLALRRNRARWRNALWVWVPVALIIYGIYVTRSRGGVLALTCVLALSVRERFGNVRTAVVAGGALATLLALGFVGNRSMSIDQSAAGRIDAWSSGLVLLKSSPVWGVGLGMFSEYHPVAPHSSFVQCFAELGFVGYVLWLGLMMLTLDDMQSVIACPNDQAAELGRWARAVLIALIGFLVGAIFLSRSYDVILFILLGLGSAIADVARQRGYVLRVRSVVVWSYFVPLVAATSIILLWLYMRLFR